MKHVDFLRDPLRDGRVGTRTVREDGDGMGGYAHLFEEMERKAAAADRRIAPRAEPGEAPADSAPRQGHHAKRMH